MKISDLIEYLDGEAPPESRRRVERDLSLDPLARDLFHRLCRQRLMLAQILRTAPKTRKPAFRLSWQVAAALLLFTATVALLWTPPDPAPEPVTQVLGGTAFAGGRVIRTIPPHTPVDTGDDSGAEIRLREGTTVALEPRSSAIFHGPSTGAREVVALRRGSARFEVPRSRDEVQVRTSMGLMTVRSAEFTVELVPGPHKGGTSMESLLAIVVSVLAGSVQVDVAGHSTLVSVGETCAFAADGAVAGSLLQLLTAQDRDRQEGEKEKDKKKDGEGDREEGKKKEKEGDRPREEGKKKDKEKGPDREREEEPRKK